VSTTDPVVTGAGLGPGLLERGVRRFVEAELPHLSIGATRPPSGPAPGTPVDIAAIGTTAARAVRGELLAHAVTGAGYLLRSTEDRPDPAGLLADATWQLGVALSPWKREIGAHCDVLAPSASITGVVDTVVRTPTGTVGFNTNTWAALSALETLTGAVPPARILLLGSGASARSVALAVGRAWSACELVIAARSPGPAKALAEAFGARLFGEGTVESERPGGYAVVVNTTTWGETEASEQEPLGIDLEGILLPGVGLFDLNNRIGALPNRALAAGCVVVSGAVMQRVTNATRAALLGYAVPAPAG
jgi:shikimate dehydrogenase